MLFCIVEGNIFPANMILHAELFIGNLIIYLRLSSSMLFGMIFIFSFITKQALGVDIQVSEH